MHDLCKEIKENTRGSRALDKKIFSRVCEKMPNVDGLADWYFNGRLVYIGGRPDISEWPESPHFTTSLQDAMLLVPDGFSITMTGMPPAGGFEITLDNDILETRTIGEADRAPAALCLASLRAIEEIRRLREEERRLEQENDTA